VGCGRTARREHGRPHRTRRVLMSASYVRSYYRVPAELNMRVTVNGRDGTIAGFPNQYIAVLFDGETETVRCHPTWRVEYHAIPTPKEN
jgi:hypothetical protein